MWRGGGRFRETWVGLFNYQDRPGEVTIEVFGDGVSGVEKVPLGVGQRTSRALSGILSRLGNGQWDLGVRIRAPFPIAVSVAVWDDPNYSRQAEVRDLYPVERCR